MRYIPGDPEGGTEGGGRSIGRRRPTFNAKGVESYEAISPSSESLSLARSPKGLLDGDGEDAHARVEHIVRS